MSTANIVSIEPVLPIGVNVTFSCNHGREQRTYFYSAPEAIAGILNGDDPAQWGGTLVDGNSGGSGAGSIASAIGEIADIGGV